MVVGRADHSVQEGREAPAGGPILVRPTEPVLKHLDHKSPKGTARFGAHLPWPGEAPGWRETPPRLLPSFLKVTVALNGHSVSFCS